MYVYSGKETGVLLESQLMHQSERKRGWDSSFIHTITIESKGVRGVYGSVQAKVTRKKTHYNMVGLARP